MCYNRTRRGTDAETKSSGRIHGERRWTRLVAGPAPQWWRLSQGRGRLARGGCFAVLSGVLAPAGIQALQTGVYGVRLLHVLRGLLL